MSARAPSRPDRSLGTSRDEEASASGRPECRDSQPATKASAEVAERARAEKALRLSEEKYRLLADNVADVIFTMDLNLAFTYASPSIRRLSGYGPEEIMSVGLDGILTPPSVEAAWNALTEELAAEHDEGADPDRSRILELEERRKDGSIIWIEVSIRFLRDDNGTATGLLGTARDITERKTVETALLQAKEEAEALSRQLESAVASARQMAVEAQAANRAKSEFLANMSHEIRTPMNGVLGMIGLLLDTELSEEQAEYAKTVRSSSLALLTIINQILDLSKIEAGKMELEEIDFDLRVALSETNEMMATRAGDKGLAFACVVDPDVPSLLRGDPGRVRQVLVNLMDNAIKFTDQGQVSVSARLLNENDEWAQLRFEVADTGMGIEKDKQDELFEAFTQADASTTRKYGGTGLGLTISKRLAEQMGGQMGVESEPTKGSTFWFTVAFAKQPPEPVADLDEVPQLLDVKILAVDESPTNRRLLSALLDSWGCRHDQAANARDAMAKLRAAVADGDPFRIALLDMHMPAADGEILAKQIKADPTLTSTLLVMMTSTAERGDAGRLEQAGFAALLTKPIKPFQLHDSLVMVLGRSLRPGPAAGDQIITRFSVEENRRRRFRILLAEDEPVDRKVALTILQKLGFRCAAVSDGREALEALKSAPYDLVLMDCQMPGMDGYEATRQIRDAKSSVQDHHVPVIAMTASAMKGDRDRCLQAGMNDYVCKPVDAQALTDILERWLVAPGAQ